MSVDWAARRIRFDDAPSLTDLVGAVDSFAAVHLFRAPLLTSTQPSTLGQLPSVEELWTRLLNGGTRRPAFRLVQAGETTGRGGITRSVGIGNQTLSDVIDANAVVERYRSGDTVVLQGLHHTDRHLARLVTNLSLDLDHPTQANAYLSPPQQQGLDIHFDYHDVIVIQLGGTKKWRVWDRIERSVDPVRSVGKVPPPRPSELSDPIIETVLGSGDILYLPRGFPHAATTTEEPSDHLTIGITTLTKYRFAQELLTAAVRKGRLRESLPSDGLERTGVTPVSTVDLVVEMVGDERSYREWRAREVWRRMPQTRLRPRTMFGAEGATVSAVADIMIDDAAEFALQPGPLLWATRDQNAVRLGLGDRVLTMPTEAFPLLREILEANDVIRARDMRALDLDSVRAVMRRLIAEGTLARAATARST